MICEGHDTRVGYASMESVSSIVIIARLLSPFSTPLRVIAPTRNNWRQPLLLHGLLLKMHQQHLNFEGTEPLFRKDASSGAGRKATYGTNIQQADSIDDNPMPSWTRAIADSQWRIFPQTIAHRGYKAEHPENTLSAFKGAVEVGTHAIETDIHLSKDHVVVLSHDPDLKRCFGREEKLIDCDWEYLSSLRTLKAPHEPMPRLKDLLEYVAQPGLEHIWILLDIKMDNNADDVMRLIATTLESVDPGARAWEERVVLGIWAAKFLPLCRKHMPKYPISNIGFSTCYSRQFLKVPNVSFNMLQKVLMGPVGARFIRDVRKAGRPLYVWTVNETNLMKWSIQKGMDGVITDDPKQFKRICDDWNEQEPRAKPTWRQLLYTLWLWILIIVFSLPFKRRFPETVEQVIKKNELRAKATAKLSQS
ncbi:Phosphatidylglycerol phospholipase C [Exophiala dermatitidis]